jgi:hypothetical protein
MISLIKLLIGYINNAAVDYSESQKIRYISNLADLVYDMDIGDLIWNLFQELLLTACIALSGRVGENTVRPAPEIKDLLFFIVRY